MTAVITLSKQYHEINEIKLLLMLQALKMGGLVQRQNTLVTFSFLSSVTCVQNKDQGI